MAISRRDFARLAVLGVPAAYLERSGFDFKFPLLPGNLDPRKLGEALYKTDTIGSMIRGGPDRGGLRFSPHIYNSMTEVERAVNALRRYMRNGV